MKKFFLLTTMLFLIAVTDSFGIVANQFKADSCSQIVLKNGDIIQADILQITSTDVKYKRCGKPDDPEMVLTKKEVLSVTATDGVVIFRNNNPENEGDKVTGKKVNYKAVVSFVTPIIGLFLPISLIWLILGLSIGGVINGAVALSEIKKNPGMYRKADKTLAILGIICGSITFLVLLLLLILILG